MDNIHQLFSADATFYVLTCFDYDNKKYTFNIRLLYAKWKNFSSQWPKTKLNSISISVLFVSGLDPGHYTPS